MNFLTLSVDSRITNGLLLYHGKFTRRGALVVVDSEVRGCFDITWGVIVEENLMEHDQCFNIAAFVTRTSV